ncbi:MAG: ribosome recycling factor [Pseudobacteriovorax sp.]|nr:ribosome recycling factor [Pseudobacteriovorax sp.]
MEELITQCKENMDKRIAGFDKDLTRVRTGRASITLLDGIRVDYYGAPTPLSQVASLSTPDARTIVVSPFEKSLIRDIEKSIMKADIGIQPTNDGVVVRIPIPQLTEDRRKDIVKQIKKMGEETKVSLRHIRRDANDEAKKAEKAKEITEDENKSLQQDIQKLTDQYTKKVDERVSNKEKEVMKV